MKHRILLLFVLFLISSCDLIISGSYPYSENYTFDISRDKLIARIKELKNKNPDYKVITTFEKGEKGELPDGMNPQDTSSVFYTCYFYIRDSHMTLHCVINISNQVSSCPARIQLTSMTKSINFGNWKDINTKYLSKSENSQIKKIFESQILDKLGTWRRDW